MAYIFPIFADMCKRFFLVLFFLTAVFSAHAQKDARSFFFHEDTDLFYCPADLSDQRMLKLEGDKLCLTWTEDRTGHKLTGHAGFDGSILSVDDLRDELSGAAVAEAFTIFNIPQPGKKNEWNSMLNDGTMLSCTSEMRVVEITGVMAVEVVKTTYQEVKSGKNVRGGILAVTYWCMEYGLLAFSPEPDVLLLHPAIVSKKLKEKKWYDISVSTDLINFEDLDVKPSFMGGDTETFAKWVSQRLVIPGDKIEGSISGVVQLEFAIYPDGQMRDIKLLHGLHPLLDAEAMRVVSEAPKWTPGYVKGVPVKVIYVFPVAFSIIKQ